MAGTDSPKMKGGTQENLGECLGDGRKDGKGDGVMGSTTGRLGEPKGKVFPINKSMT